MSMFPPMHPKSDPDGQRVMNLTEYRLKQMRDAAEMLWTVVANVSGGDWTDQTPEWQAAAVRWRDAYFAAEDLCKREGLSISMPTPPSE